MKRMFLLIVLIIVLGIIVWFTIPYSPLKTEFKTDVDTEVKKLTVSENAVFQEADFQYFPEVIRNYIKHNGYLGTKRNKTLSMNYKDVDFSQGLNGPTLKIDYTLTNFSDKPDRLAFIDSKMFGIPFQGYDYFKDGNGGMKGVLAKSITLFNQTGDAMNKACLVTYLAECLFLPESLLAGRIVFNQIDDFSVEATIVYKDITANGIFYFNENYEMTHFVSYDRAQIGGDGELIYLPWTAKCGDYNVDKTGINRPRKFSAVWNCPDKDFVYFDGCIDEMK
ncbi:MAG: hypothetical protein MJ198_08325 [Bacteroidales bacterium]|nr:hypothetical protein [Bacteroidales bacterium]